MPAMNWKDKVILLTGGTGSFGRAFTELMLKKHKPKSLRIFSNDEYGEFEMRQQYGDPHPILRYLLGDVRDKDRLERAMDSCDIVVHAAALKQIPQLEYNPAEAVKTNILGSQNVIEAAIAAGVKKAVLISSDKAVNPINVYGATKLVAEKLFIQGNVYAGAKVTRFVVVRYGNVAASRGSVIPLFFEQAKKGELTVTDSRMTRFWITLDEGVEFVVNSISEMQGGEVFVPKIPSVKVTDLAKAIAPAAKLKEIGIRPGEKLHEVLITEEEARHTIKLPDKFVIYPEFPWWSEKLWEKEKKLKKLPEGFRYSSDKNSNWLTVPQLKNLLKNLKTEG